jgi:predicted AAA+ superfamily ATPase
MIKRDIAGKLKAYAKNYPVVTITGPRQSGKTTLCRKLFASHAYFSLEDLDVRARAVNDPRSFLEDCLKTGAVLDEIQRAPELTSYIQGIVDEQQINGQFILTGSQWFMLLNVAAGFHA